MDTEMVVSEAEAKSASPARRPRGLVNAQWAKGLDTAEQLVRVAQRESVAAALTSEEFPPALTAALGGKIEACRAQLAVYLSATTERQTETARENTLRLVLIGLLQGVQTAAKRKWARSATEQSHLKGYFVGVTLKTMGFAALSEAADAILRQARQDALPGITPEKLTALSDAIALWKGHDAAQSAAQNAATQAHTEAERLFGEITTERIQLQLAAEAAFPHTEKANAAIRVEFGLPKNGPCKAI